ncbi:conjugal transfer protein TraF [Nissabacter sp. SGAir0207]|uniref:conjugal transfer protein TraF n=1 Tax=Nissabacter sp. SGAir0207 TaxID=2126321 RepID=UPI0010CCEC91|nr:conjugal transfer protein TraF [Nissabacter sp. SGAir0207]QCR35639.1 conjugal transfer protein TraF [Nissabacter sp. SGAir0207]
MLPQCHFNLLRARVAPLLLLAPFSALAAGHGVEARNDAMGGVGVASSLYGSAVLANPALMTQAAEGAGVSVILPAVGVQLTDGDHTLDKIDQIPDAIARFRTGVTDYASLRGAAGSLASQLREVQGNRAWGHAGAALAVTLPDDEWPMALVVNAYGSARVTAEIDQGDIDYLQQIADGRRLPRPGDQDQLTSRGHGLAALVTDYGVALAHPFRVGGMPVSFGITPKIQHTALFNYDRAIYDYDKSDLTSGRYQRNQTGFNLDAGLSAQPGRDWTLGLSARNLVPRDLDTKEVEGRRDTYRIRPLVTSGVAWQHERLTAALDVDLTPDSRFRSEGKRQYAGAGVEYRAREWLQLRAGYRADMRSTDANVATAGVGLSPSPRVRLDLAGMAGEERTWGAVAQLSLTF